MKPKSKRFTPTQWTERLVPVILAILGLALILTMALVIAASFGWLRF